MAPEHQIRACYDRSTITVYQAYSDAIAAPALSAGRFVPPFSMHRMTWIKPSFLWLMARSGWGRRDGWDAALAEAVLTAFDPRAHASREAWREAFEIAPVHVQWDPERSIRGAKLPHRSIQVGISRHRIGAYVDEWIVELRDETPRVHKMRRLIEQGRASDAARHLPPERDYPVAPETARRLGMR